MLAGRPVGVILRSLVGRQHYEALAGMARTLPQFADCFSRYLLGRGSYPFQVAIRTPSGRIRPTLYSHADMLTVNEVFCRLDYRVPDDLKVAVDIGSNIGLSALYFLTRNRSSRAYLFEPVPRNIERLTGNLAAFRDRYALSPVAIADRSGDAAFGVEPSGRYGGLTVEAREHIKVRCLHVNEALSGILGKEREVDVLKIDTEGTEWQIVQCIAPEIRERIGLILLEGTAGVRRIEREAPGRYSALPISTPSSPR